jgi:hypothetical protein
VFAVFIPSFSSHFGGIEVGLYEERVVYRLLTRYAMRARMFSYVLDQLSARRLLSRA